MQYPIVIKKGSLALIKNLIVTEVSIGLFLFILSFVTDYQTIYSQSALGRVIRYDYSLIVAASFLQLAATLLIFLRWHNKHYEIRKKEIISIEGIFSTSQNSFPLKNIKSIDYKQGPLEKLMKCGTIVVHDINSKDPLYLHNVENAKVVSGILKNLVEEVGLPSSEKTKKVSVLDLILEGESHYLEFKQTFRWDIRQKTTNKALEKIVMKTIAGFLNSDGGRLVIGVSDDKRVYGLEDDYKTLPKANKDSFENHFNQVFNTAFNGKFRQFVTIVFEIIDGKDVCLIEVRPGDEPAYLDTDHNEEFFVRAGNTTAPLAISKAANYIKSRWK